MPIYGLLQAIKIPMKSLRPEKRLTSLTFTSKPTTPCCIFTLPTNRSQQNEHRSLLVRCSLTGALNTDSQVSSPSTKKWITAWRGRLLVRNWLSCQALTGVFNALCSMQRSETSESTSGSLKLSRVLQTLSQQQS